MLMMENLVPIDFGEVRCLMIIMYITIIFIALACEVRTNILACLASITLILFVEHSLLYDEEWSALMVIQKLISVLACFVTLLASSMIFTHVITEQAEMQIKFEFQ